MGPPSIVMVGVLLLVAGWRWYDAGVTMPVQIDRVAGPAMILVVQEGDCPDRRSALEAWFEREREDPADDGVSPVVSVLAGPDPPRSSALAGLPVLSRSAHADVIRALLRSGVGATPAILLVDRDGFPVLAFGFEATGPGPRAHLVSRVLPTHASPAQSPASADSLPPRTRGDALRWNP